MIHARGTVKRVYKHTQGGVLAQALTGTWTNGGSVLVEAATHFSPDGGDGLFEDEAFSYGGVSINPSDAIGAKDSLTGVTRANPVAHAVGTFVQEGSTETVTKMVDIEVDGELFTGIPVDPSVYAYLKLGTYADDEMPVVAVEFDEDGLARVTSAPVGAVPSFDQDGEVLPPIDEMPPPVVGGKKPSAPTSFNVTARNTTAPDGTLVHFIDAVYTHSGLYDDDSEITGLHFRADIYDGATKRWVIDAGSSLSWTQQVEGNKTYDVNLYALDFANTESDAAVDSVSTSPDSSAPATPTGLALLGGAGGGGVGIIYSLWIPNTESDFKHYEVHASTVSSGFTPSASTLIAETGSTNHAISKAYNGTSITTFGYTTTVHVKLKAVDRSGNKSAASSVASSTAAQAASADITDIQSDNYVLGTSGWRLTKAGNLEANSGTFRGSLTATTIVSMSTGSNGIVITGSTNEIALGSGLKLDGDGNGSISFGSSGQCTISGTGTGSVNVGTGITLSGTDGGGGSAGKITVGSGIVLNGAGTGTISGGTITSTTITASSITSASSSPRGAAATVKLADGEVRFTVQDSVSDIATIQAGTSTATGLAHLYLSGQFIEIDGTFLIGTDSSTPPAAGLVACYKDGNAVKFKDSSGQIGTVTLS